MNKTLKIVIVISAIGLFLAGSSWYLVSQLKPPSAANQGKIIFEIKPGTPSRQIAENLKSRHFIKSKWLFLIYLKLKGGLIQAGTYELSSSNNLQEIVQILTSGYVKEWLVTFPEGFSLKDMAERLENKKIVRKEDFLQEASRLAKYQKDFSFLSEIKTANLEGYLFPDTYRLPLETSSEEIIRKMLKNFEQKIYSKTKADYKTIILASIIEREAKKPEDRPKIASVFLNRLAAGLKLEADPTIQYAKGNWQPITREDYQNIDSPYNTYKYKGLPPSPICNPGLAAISAVLEPEKTSYFYFFHTKDGRTFFSLTKEEHEKKKKEYLK